MAQRQFRTDDTSYWADRYGDGSDGAYAPSSTAWSSNYTTLTGTSGSTSATVGSGTGFFAGALVIIHQSKGTGFGNWELNKISSTGGGTNWTMAYDLMNTYATGAQVVLIKVHSTVTIGGGVTVTTPSYNGSTGGIIAIFAQQSITVTGSINANGAGYLGGAGGVGGSTHSYGVQGQSGTGDGSRVSSANDSGGGGGESHVGGDAGGGGGGGGHSTSGVTGVNGNTSPTPFGGTGGGTSGSAALTTMTFGGAGGGGGIDDSTTGGVGGNSGGFIFLCAPVITVSGTVTVNGDNGTSHGDSGGGGGGGAGGSLLLKGQQVTVGSNLVAAGGGFGASGNSAFGGVGGAGGNGGAGRIHIDYSQLLSGSSNSPAFDSSVDAILNDLPNLQNYTLLI